MTKRTLPQKRRVQAEPVKSQTLFEEVVNIPDANERSSALAELDLTEGQKDAAVRVARRDFLEGGLENDLATEQEVKPNNRAQKLVDELTAKNIIVPYPSDYSKWTPEFYDRLENLNR